jgi:hypothetical protein
MSNIDPVDDLGNSIDVGNRVRAIVHQNPYMASDMPGVLALATSSTPTVQLISHAGALYGQVTAQNLADNLSKLDPAAQRGIVATLGAAERLALSQSGYSPPEASKSNFEKALSGIGNVAGKILQPVANAVDYVAGPVIRPTLHALTWASDQPAHLYRTIRTMNSWEQAAGMIGMAVGGTAAALLAPITGGGSLAVFGAVAVGALAGGTLGAETAAVVTGHPNDWYNAFANSWDGDKTFANSAVAKANDLLGDPRVLTIAKALADQDYDVAVFARELAATDAEGLDNKQLEVIKSIATDIAVEGTPQYKTVYGNLLNLALDPTFQEAVGVLRNGKISAGRDVAETIGLPLGSTEYNIVSGAVDAAWVISLDPTLLIGKASEAARFARRGILVPDGAEAVARVADISYNNPAVRRLHQKAAAYIAAGDFIKLGQEFPTMRGMVLQFQEYRNAEWASGRIAEGTFSHADFVEMFTSKSNLSPLMQGIGTVRSHSRPGIILSGQSKRSEMMTDLFGRVRSFTNGWSDIVKEGHIGKAIDEMADKYSSLPHATQMPSPYHQDGRLINKDILEEFVPADVYGVISDDGMIANAWMYDQAHPWSMYAGRKLGETTQRIPGVRSIPDVLNAITTMTPGRHVISIVGKNAYKDIKGVTELGAVLGMPSYTRRAWADAIIAAENPAARMRLLSGYMDNALTLTGLKATEEGQEIAKKVLERFFHVYGQGGEEIMLIDGRMHQASHIWASDSASEMVMPDLKELQKVAAQGTWAKAFGLVDNPMLEKGMSKIWKPAVLLRPAFILRAAGDEFLGLLVHGGFGSIVQEFGARNIAHFDEYKIAIELREQNMLYNAGRLKIKPELLTDAQKVLLAQGPAPAHLRGLWHAMAHAEWTAPMRNVMERYGEFLTEGLRGGLSGAATGGTVRLGEYSQRIPKYMLSKDATGIEKLLNNARGNAEQLMLGGQHSWRRMVMGGVDDGLVNAARAYQRKWQTVMMREISASNAGVFDRGYDANNTKRYMVKGDDGVLREEQFVALRHQQRRLSLDDGYFKNAVHNQAYQPFEDPIAGEVFHNSLWRTKGASQMNDADIVDHIIHYQRVANSDPIIKLLVDEVAHTSNAASWKAAVANIRKHNERLGEALNKIRESAIGPSAEEVGKVLDFMANQFPNDPELNFIALKWDDAANYSDRVNSIEHLDTRHHVIAAGVSTHGQGITPDMLRERLAAVDLHAEALAKAEEEVGRTQLALQRMGDNWAMLEADELQLYHEADRAQQNLLALKGMTPAEAYQVQLADAERDVELARLRLDPLGTNGEMTAAEADAAEENWIHATNRLLNLRENPTGLYRPDRILYRGTQGPWTQEVLPDGTLRIHGHYQNHWDGKAISFTTRRDHALQYTANSHDDPNPLGLLFEYDRGHMESVYGATDKEIENIWNHRRMFSGKDGWHDEGFHMVGDNNEIGYTFTSRVNAQGELIARLQDELSVLRTERDAWYKEVEYQHQIANPHEYMNDTVSSVWDLPDRTLDLENHPFPKQDELDRLTDEFEQINWSEGHTYDEMGAQSWREMITTTHNPVEYIDIAPGHWRATMPNLPTKASVAEEQAHFLSQINYQQNVIDNVNWDEFWGPKLGPKVKELADQYIDKVDWVHLGNFDRDISTVVFWDHLPQEFHQSIAKLETANAAELDRHLQTLRNDPFYELLDLDTPKTRGAVVERYLIAHYNKGVFAENVSQLGEQLATIDQIPNIVLEKIKGYMADLKSYSTADLEEKLQNYAFAQSNARLISKDEQLQAAIEQGINAQRFNYQAITPSDPLDPTVNDALIHLMAGETLHSQLDTVFGEVMRRTGESKVELVDRLARQQATALETPEELLNKAKLQWHYLRRQNGVGLTASRKDIGEFPGVEEANRMFEELFYKDPNKRVAYRLSQNSISDVDLTVPNIPDSYEQYAIDVYGEGAPALEEFKALQEWARPYTKDRDYKDFYPDPFTGKPKMVTSTGRDQGMLNNGKLEWPENHYKTELLAYMNQRGWNSVLNSSDPLETLTRQLAQKTGSFGNGSQTVAGTMAPQKLFVQDYSELGTTIVPDLRGAVLNAHNQDKAMFSQRMMNPNGGASDAAASLTSGQVQLFAVPIMAQGPTVGQPLTFEMLLAQSNNPRILQRNEGAVRALLVHDANPGAINGSQALLADHQLAEELTVTYSRLMSIPTQPVSTASVARDVLRGKYASSDGAIQPYYSGSKSNAGPTQVFRADKGVVQLQPISSELTDRAQSWAELMFGRAQQVHTRGTTESFVARFGNPAKGTTTPTQLVFTKDNMGNLEPVKATDVFNDKNTKFFTADKKPIRLADVAYFKPHDVKVGAKSEAMWPLLGPMIEDGQDLRTGMSRLVPKDQFQFEAGQMVPTTDVVRAYRSKAEHVQNVGDGVPNWTFAETLVPVDKKNIWERFVTYGFDKVLGPGIDALARKPLAFHFFQQRYQQNIKFLDWLVDPEIRDSVLNVMARQTEGMQDEIAAVSQHARNLANDVDPNSHALGWTNNQALSWLRSYKGDDLNNMLDGVRQRVAIQANSGNWSDAVRQQNLQTMISANAIKARDPQALAKLMSPTDVGDYLSFVRSSLPDQNVLDNAGAAMRSAKKMDDYDEVTQTLLVGGPFHNFAYEDWEALAAAERNWQHIDNAAGEYAAEAAINDIMPLVDSHEMRTQFAEYGRGFLPFQYAEENFLRRWATTVLESPQSIEKARLGYMGLKSAGVIRTDENGKDFFHYPGSGLFIDALEKIGNALGWQNLGTTAASVVGVEFQTPTDKLLPGFHSSIGKPAIGPIVSLPLSFLTSLAPELTPIKQALQGDYTTTNSMLEQIIPTQFVNTFKALLTNPDGNAKYMAAQNSALAQLQATRHGLPENATANQKEEYLDRVRNWSRIVFIAQALAGWITPGPPGLMSSAQNDADPFTAIKDPRSQLSKTYATLVQNLGIEQGTIEFLRVVPNAKLGDLLHPIAYTVGQSTSKSGAPLPATKEAGAFFDENSKYILSFPNAGPWLLPQDPTGESAHSQYAYDQQTISELRDKRTPTEFLDAMLFKQGSILYFEAKDKFDAKMQELKLANNKKGQAILQENWDIKSAIYKAAHPTFTAQLQNSDAKQRRADVLTEMRTIIKDPQAPKPPHMPDLIRVMNGFEAYEAKLNELSSDRSVEGSVKRNKLKANWKLYLDNMQATRPAMQSFILSVIVPESGL